MIANHVVGIMMTGMKIGMMIKLFPKFIWK